VDPLCAPSLACIGMDAHDGYGRTPGIRKEFRRVGLAHAIVNLACSNVDRRRSYAFPFIQQPIKGERLCIDYHRTTDPLVGAAQDPGSCPHAQCLASDVDHTQSSIFKCAEVGTLPTEVYVSENGVSEMWLESRHAVEVEYRNPRADKPWGSRAIEKLAGKKSASGKFHTVLPGSWATLP